MNLLWYVINSRPYKEENLWNQLLARGIETYYPRIKVNPVNPRSRKIRPYFPGYLFIHVDLAEIGISAVQWIPYAKNLVNFGGEPAFVPDPFIAALKARLGELVEESRPESFQPGATVLITSGLFAGYEAIFNTHLPGTERVRVLLKMLVNHHVSLELNADQIQKKNQTKR